MSCQGFTTAILLAAGGSTRLGRPKQLLPWKGSTFIGSTINQLAIAGCDRLIVVLGAHESEVREHCVAPSSVQLNIVTNVEWSNGQGTSLREGIKYAIAVKDIGVTLIALCDQPLIDSTHYRDLIAKVRRLGYFAAATEYPEGLGVPACVSLLALQSLSLSVGDTGAKKWLREQPQHKVSGLTAPAAILDVDTELDYRKILKHDQVV